MPATRLTAYKRLSEILACPESGPHPQRPALHVPRPTAAPLGDGEYEAEDDK
jgi:hypothetical protein